MSFYSAHPKIQYLISKSILSKSGNMRWLGFYFSWLIQFFKMPRGSNWPPWWFYCEYHDSFRSKPLMLVFKIQYPSLTIAVFCGGAVSLTVKHVVHRWVTLLSWHNYWTFPVDDSQPKAAVHIFLNRLTDPSDIQIWHTVQSPKNSAVYIFLTYCFNVDRYKQTTTNMMKVIWS